METDTPNDLKTVVCIGVFFSLKGPFTFFHEIDNHGELVTKEFGFKYGPMTKRFEPGQMYEVRNPSENQWQLSSAKWVGTWRVAEQVAEWQAQHASSKLRMREARNEKKFGNATSGLDVHINALRNAYLSLISADRLPFELWVLSQIRSRS